MIIIIMESAVRVLEWGLDGHGRVLRNLCQSGRTEKGPADPGGPDA